MKQRTFDIFPKPDIRLIHGHCLPVMKGFADNLVDSIITDPPYALEFMGKGWDKVLPDPAVWIEGLRVAKPGAILMAFGGDRTHHSRIKYCAKSSKSERGEGNTHVAVKPLKLMEYLCKLTMTPTGGVVLDPFMGSGTTGVACRNLNRNFIGIELNETYFEIAKERIDGTQYNLLLEPTSKDSGGSA